jgi:hypothetical protein
MFFGILMGAQVLLKLSQQLFLLRDFPPQVRTRRGDARGLRFFGEQGSEISICRFGRRDMSTAD